MPLISAGVIPARKTPEGWKLLILRAYRNWDFPNDGRFAGWETRPMSKPVCIVVLPHIGGLHPERDEGVAEVFVANARRFLAREPLETAVDRVLGY